MTDSPRYSVRIVAAASVDPRRHLVDDRDLFWPWRPGFGLHDRSLVSLRPRAARRGSVETASPRQAGIRPLRAGWRTGCLRLGCGLALALVENATRRRRTSRQAVWASSSSVTVIFAGSIGIPGPIVDERVTERMYLPLAADGFARCSSSRTARMFAEELGAVERRLADRNVDVADTVGSVLDPTGAKLSDGLADLGCHRAGLRVRHQAARPENPARAGRPGPSGQAWRWRRRSRGSPLLRRGSQDRRRRRRRHRRHEPRRRLTGGEDRDAKRSCPSRPEVKASRARFARRAAGSTPRRTASSTVSSNFAVARLFTRSTASAGE